MICVERQDLQVYITVAMAFLSVFLCYIFIDVYHFKVRGAAFATSISYTMGFIVITVIVYMINELRVGIVKPDFDIIIKSFNHFGEVIGPALLACFEFWVFEAITIMSA
jgi:Na+-driven multidrug efflux pump